MYKIPYELAQIIFNVEASVYKHSSKESLQVVNNEVVYTAGNYKLTKSLEDFVICCHFNFAFPLGYWLMFNKRLNRTTVLSGYEYHYLEYRIVSNSFEQSVFDACQWILDNSSTEIILTLSTHKVNLSI